MEQIERDTRSEAGAHNGRLGKLKGLVAIGAMLGLAMLGVWWATPSIWAQSRDRRPMAFSAPPGLHLPLVFDEAALGPTPALPTPPALPSPGPAPTLEPSGGRLSLVSVSPAGDPADADCLAPALSADGRYVAFASAAANLLPTGADGWMHLFRIDLQTGTRERLDSEDAHIPGAVAGHAGRSALSADGRVVAFESAAPLAAGDRNSTYDIYIWREGAEEADQNPADQNPADQNPADQNPLVRAGLPPFGELSQGAERPVLSANGALLAFDSASPELLPGGGTIGERGVFVQDLVTGVIVRVSLDVAGPSLRPAMSADGRFIAFQVVGDNPALGDRNGMDDIYLYDGARGRTTRVSQAWEGGDSDGPSFAPAISGDGRFVAYVSAATNLVDGDINGLADILVFDRAIGLTERVSVGAGAARPAANGPSDRPALSADGRYVAFCSEATNLVPGDTNGVADVFLFDRATGTMVCLSQGYDGRPADGPSYWPAISADGDTVVFVSEAGNLLPPASGGTERRKQVYVWKRD
ncbi:MAG: PD40 domain-containing protein [Chloroflexi bacterium]|nr:PD40 domain-containing protein [Chloroflexota bacterium]